MQWGDEGKGKIVDVFTQRYDVIARFQGGPNAGHTIIFDNQKYILHTIPSGIFHENSKNIIGNGVVLEPLIFQNEILKIENRIPDLYSKLFISCKAHLILPSHRLLDAAYEAYKGKEKIGSTLKGIGPTYTDKIARCGLRVGDVQRSDFGERYLKLKNQHLLLARNLEFDYKNHQIDGLSFENYEKLWMEAAYSLKKFNIVETEFMTNQALDKGHKILAEGAQGTLLDIDFGTYPFVTSSNTTSSGVCSGLGVAPKRIGEVYGVFKAYCTRVGSGPFPTELNDDTGTYLREQGAEFGSTTGRPRRCGWLDLPALKYACMLNGTTALIMTKTDVLSGLKNIKIATHYKYKGEIIDYFPFDMSFEAVEPVYHTMEGWNEDLTLSTDGDTLPEKLKQYILFIESYLKIPIVVVSVGPDRLQTIFMDKQSNY